MGTFWTQQILIVSVSHAACYKEESEAHVCSFKYSIRNFFLFMVLKNFYISKINAIAVQLHKWTTFTDHKAHYRNEPKYG